MAQRVLLVSYYYAPQNAIGAVRPTKLAKYLTRMGYEVTVLCGKPYSTARDPVLANDMAGVHAVRAVRERSLLRWWKERGMQTSSTPTLPERAALPAQGVSHEGMQAKATAYQTKPNSSVPATPPQSGKSKLDSLYLWLAFCADAAFARACVRELLLMGEHYDVVISSYGPLSVHTIARWAKRLGIAQRWIADFRDEATVPFSWLKGYLKRYILRVRKHADAITAVSLGFLQMMELENFGQVVPNGYDREDIDVVAPMVLEKDMLTLTYCGHVYPGKADVSPVFSAIRALIDAGVCDPAHVRFHYAGKEGAAFSAAAAHFGLTDRVIDHGFLPRAQSIALQHASDVLMAATWNTAARRGVVTGKLMEYMMADRPILCCVSGELPNSDARTIMQTTRAGFGFEQANATADTKALQAYLQTLYKARIAGDPLPFSPDREAVDGYDYKNIAHTFSKLIDTV